MWALLFALGSFYLASGGTIGTALLADELKEQMLARDPTLVTVLWVSGGLKSVASIFAFNLSRSWTMPWRVVLKVLAWCTGVVLVVWGSGYLLVGSLVLSAVVETPLAWGPNAARWYVMVWGPVWVLGGALFMIAAQQLPKSTTRGELDVPKVDPHLSHTSVDARQR